MELVYLWVEDYKNIKKQGFNFSPRFHCEFFPEYEKDENGNEKLKENCKLEIKEKKDYIPDFFGENINITAIVGKNGSGKSNIFEAILRNAFHPDITLTLQPRLFSIYVENDNFFYEKCNIRFNCDREIRKLDYQQTYFLHYDESMAKIADYNIVINSAPNIFLFPPKEEKFNNHRYNEELKNILLFMSKKFQKSKLHKFFYPDQVYIDLDNAISNDTREINKYSEYLKEYCYKRYKIFEHESGLDILLDIPKVTKNFDNWEKVITKVNNKIKNEPSNQKMAIDEVLKFDMLLKNFEHFLSLFQLEADEILNSVETKYSHDKESLKKSKINIAKRNFVINVNIINEESIALLLNLPKSLNFEVYDRSKDIKLKDLSNGEKNLLNVRLYLERVFTDNRNKSFIVLVDEAETYLHPEWQKSIIEYFIDSFKEYRVHFLFTSHSPFLLSDIPKQNIIFLDTDDDGKCKVLNNDEVMNKKETFGANIHTLLSDSFFMEDGLMGEFAKEKINSLIQYLKPHDERKATDKQVDMDDTKAQKLIDMIGEPVLQKTLQSMLDEKIYPKESKLDKLKRQQEKLEKEIKKLEDKSDEKG